MIKNNKAVILLLGVLIAPLAIGDTVTFSDNFDAETPGFSRTFLKKWSVSNAGAGGSVDVINNGLYGAPCAGNVGRCLDLDGSTSASADLISNALTLTTGTYILSYKLAGNPTDSNTVDILFDGVLLRTVTLDSKVPYTAFSDVINITSSRNGSIEFRHTGGDRMGLLLDNVVLTRRVVDGNVTWTKLPYYVSCKNNTTSQIVTIPINKKSTYNCEKSGLVVKTGENVTVTITGVKK